MVADRTDLRGRSDGVRRRLIRGASYDPFMGAGHPAPLLLLAACGRIGFSVAPGTTGDGGPDGDASGDAVSSTCAPAVVGTTADGQWAVGLAAADGSYLAAWSDGTNLVARRVTVDGEVQGASPMVLGPLPTARRVVPVVLSTGTEWTVLWSETQNHVAHLARDTLAISAASTFTTGTAKRDLAAAWTGSVLGIAWRETSPNEDLVFAVFDRTGQILSPERTLASIGNGMLGTGEVVWTGTEFVVLWSEARDPTEQMFAQRLDGAGQLVGGPMLLTSATVAIASAKRLRAAWSGSQFGVAAKSIRDTTLMRFDANAIQLGARTVSTDPFAVAAIAWTGTRYGLARVEAGDDLIYEELEPSLTPTEPPLLVGADMDELGAHSIAVASNTELAVAWIDSAHQVIVTPICR